MSGKTAKAARKEIKDKEADYKARQEAFTKEIKALSAKHKIDMVAALQYKQTALVPVIVMVDVKDQYEHMTEEAKKAEQTKNQPQNSESETPPVAKLEV